MGHVPRHDDGSRRLSRWSSRHLTAVAALTAMAALIRFAGLDRDSFWLDESVTASLLERPLFSMLGELPSSESTPPLYYVLAWGWSRAFGLDPVGVRSLSALAGTLTIPAAYAAAASLISRRAGVATAAVASLSPVLVWFSQEARAYSLLVLFAALSFAFFGRALERPSAWMLAGWAATASLALLTHYFAAFLVAVEGLALLLVRRPRPATLVAVSAPAAVALALAPLVAMQSGGSATWIRGVDLPLRVGETVRQLALPSTPPLWAGVDVAESAFDWLWPAALLLVGAAVVVALRRGDLRERRGVLIAVGVASGTVLLPLGLALVAAVATDGRGDYFLSRNLVVAWIPTATAIAGGLTVRRAGAIGVVALCALVAASAGVLAWTWTDERFERDDWQLVAQALEGPRRAVVLSPSWQVDALRRHVPGLTPIPAEGAAIEEIDVAVRRTIPSYSRAVERFAPPPAFELVSRERLQHWTVTRYRAERPVLVRYADLGRIEPSGASAIVLVSDEE